MMKEINYWQQFVHTGKVDDYLQYRSSTKENADDEIREGAGYAGLRGSDGDRAQGRADRGI